MGSGGAGAMRDQPCQAFGPARRDQLGYLPAHRVPGEEVGTGDELACHVEYIVRQLLDPVRSR
jgi:hypothetical protein